MYYYLSYILFTTLGTIINLGIYVNSVANMDVIKWGKTRGVAGTAKPATPLAILDDLSDYVYDDFFYVHPNYESNNKESNISIV